MRLVEAGLAAFALPLVSPLATAHGPILVREGLLVTLEDEQGNVGFGEATPLPAFGGEDLATCRRALGAALGRLVSCADLEGIDAHLALADAALGPAVCARAALESALASLAAIRSGQSLAHWIRARAGMAGEPAPAIDVQALVAGVSPEAVALAARRARAEGYTVFKLKLAVSPAEPERGLAPDLERVAALREAVGPSARIRLDANEAWSFDAALRAFARLARFDVEWIEQPVARRDLSALARLDREGAIAVAADEALLDGGLEPCLAARAARIFVVKQAVLGGLGPAIALARRAQSAGIRLIHSNLIEGAVGRATAVDLAAALAPEPAGQSEVHGLGTASLLARETPGTSDEDEAGDHPFPLPISRADHGPARLAARSRAELVGRVRGAQAASGAQRASVSRSGDFALRLASTGWLARTADRHAGQTAFVFGDRVHDYAALARAARATGDALAEAGLGAGDLVAVLAAPSEAGFVLFHAMLERGIVLLPLNTRWTEAELARALESVRPEALLVGEEVEAGVAQRLATAAGCAHGRLGSFADGSGGARGLRSGKRRGRDLRAYGAALVLLTSGTSGRSKAAVLSLANLTASAEASAALLGSGAQDRWLLCMPLFHVAGLSILVRAALSGALVVVEPRFEASRIAALLDSACVTHVSVVATMLSELLVARGDRRAPAALRLVLVGGGPAAASLLARARRTGWPIAPTYGLTEAASQVATRPPGEEVDADESGGLAPLPGLEVRIVDAEGRALGVGEEGEIEVRGATVMQGYLDDPEATSNALRGGWLSTGDVGRLDAAGRLRVFDRRADLILSGGENVYPAEIESVLMAHPDVVEAGVAGIEDARFGARPCAFVVWRAGATCEANALAAFCRARLAGYKVPVEFVAVEALPRNASGKLLRRALNALRT